MVVAGLLILSSPWHAQLLAQAPSPAEVAAAQRRYQIRVFESVLVSSVEHAAETTVRRIQEVRPAILGPTTDVAQARGFILPDYGVFFDVEVPGLPLSLVWSMRVMERSFDVDRSLEMMRQAVASIPDAGMRRDAEQALRRVELELGEPAAATPASSTRTADPVQAAALLPTHPSVTSVPEGTDEPILSPDEAYTTEVESALIDTMIDYSGRLGLAPGDWLTVAARASRGPSYSGESYDTTTFVFRVKGRDLDDFRAERITREEVGKRIEVWEF
jgi:hypothetical protein